VQMGNGGCLGQGISWVFCRAGIALALLFLLVICVNSVVLAGEWPLHEAAERGDIDAAAKALRQGADVNGRDDRGMTPLMLAPWSGSLAMAKFLVERGADVNATTDRGVTPLITAAMKHPDIAKYLIEKGADVNAPFLVDSSGKDFFFIVGFAYLSSMDMTRLVFAKGLNVKSRDSIWSMVISALRFVGFGQDLSPQFAFFIDRGAPVNALLEGETTPLMHAAEGGHVELVRLFLAKGADVNARTENGGTALRAAGRAKSNKDQVVDMLKKAGAKE
jgi:ankyrin repeat protein